MQDSIAVRFGRRNLTYSITFCTEKKYNKFVLVAVAAYCERKEQRICSTFKIKRMFLVWGNIWFILSLTEMQQKWGKIK